MTKQQALAALGLSVLPTDAKALLAAFTTVNRATSMRLQYEPAHRDQLLQDMLLQQQAYDMLTGLVPPIPVPVPPRPIPVPPKPKPNPLPPKPRPVPPNPPVPPPRPVPPRPIPVPPVPPRPAPRPSVDWWAICSKALTIAAEVIGTLILCACSAAWSLFMALPPAGRVFLVACTLVLGSILAGCHWFYGGTAQVRPLTWPVADVYVNGGFLVEGPSPKYVAAPSGFRKVRFVARDGATYEFSVLFLPGARYELRANLRNHTVQKLRME